MSIFFCKVKGQSMEGFSFHNIFRFNRPHRQRGCTSTHMEQFILVAICNSIHGYLGLRAKAETYVSTPTAKSFMHDLYFCSDIGFVAGHQPNATRGIRIPNAFYRNAGFQDRCLTVRLSRQVGHDESHVLILKPKKL